MDYRQTRLADTRLLDIHTHRREPFDGVTIYSTRLAHLPVGFTASPEIYFLDYDPTKDKLAREKQTPRGCHAHREKRELFRVLRGRCQVILWDGQNEKHLELADPTKTLFVPPGIWHEILFGEECLLQVISSTLYSEQERTTDYITDREIFRREKDY